MDTVYVKHSHAYLLDISEQVYVITFVIARCRNAVANSWIYSHLTLCLCRSCYVEFAHIDSVEKALNMSDTSLLSRSIKVGVYPVQKIISFPWVVLARPVNYIELKLIGRYIV
jgi:hypothetical protein